MLSILFVMYSGYSAPLAALAGTLLCFPVAWFGPVVLFVLPILVVLPYIVSAFPTLIPVVFGLHPLLEAALLTALISLWLWAVRGKIILLKIELRPIIDAMIDGARNTLPVALACAAAGIIIGIVILTGLGITFTQWVVGLSQNMLLLALVLTMAAGIVLGMGMPTTPAYIIMVSLLVPALVKLGVVTPAAHMFAFYFAILSAITPPVALAVYAAAGLAKSNLWKTGWAAVKIGAAGFIVPFMFVYEPALLMIGDWPTDRVALRRVVHRHRPAGRGAARLSAAADAALAARTRDRGGAVPCRAGAHCRPHRRRPGGRGARRTVSWDRFARARVSGGGRRRSIGGSPRLGPEAAGGLVGWPSRP